MKLNTIENLRGIETARIAEEVIYSYLDFARVTGIPENDVASYLVYLFTETTTFVNDMELSEEDHKAIILEISKLIEEYSTEDTLTLWEPNPIGFIS